MEREGGWVGRAAGSPHCRDRKTEAREGRPLPGDPSESNRGPCPRPQCQGREVDKNISLLRMERGRVPGGGNAFKEGWERRAEPGQARGHL